MGEPTPPADPDVQLEELCLVLNRYEVRYLVFGSHVARLNGVPLETIDVDLVPAVERENLDRLAAALNLLGPRWRVEEIPEGMKIDGSLEARHFLGDSTAVGLLTRLGPIDVVLQPKGFEDGYPALVPRSTRWPGGAAVDGEALGAPPGGPPPPPGRGWPRREGRASRGLLGKGARMAGGAASNAGWWPYGRLLPALFALRWMTRARFGGPGLGWPRRVGRCLAGFDEGVGDVSDLDVEVL